MTAVVCGYRQFICLKGNIVMNFGLQLYSVRDSAEKDFKNTLKEVAKLGYEFVEPAGFFGHSAEEIKEWLDEYGLKVSGTHSGFEDLEKDFEGTVKFHKTIGNKRYIIPGLDTSTKAAIDVAVAKFNKFKPLLAAEGIDLMFHNHHREFMPNNDGLISHHELQKLTDINFEIDTFWAFAAGLDPVATIEGLKDRVNCIHLKDGVKKPDGGFAGRALGEGDAPVPAVIKKARELGFTIVVESEGLDPTGLEEVARCANFLKDYE